MSILDNILDRLITNLGVHKDQVEKVKKIVDCIDIKELNNKLEISINLEKIKIVIDK